MPLLRIRCFGIPSAEIDGLGRLRFQTSKTLTLLLAAATAPQLRLSRSEAAAALRMDQSEQQARRALSSDIWRLKKGFVDLGADSAEWLDVTSRGIGLRVGAPVSIDVRTFEDRLELVSAIPVAEMSDSQTAHLSQAVALYTGDALSGLDDDWALVLRERLRSRYIHALDLLLQRMMLRQNWHRAIALADRLVELDPLLEHAHRALMQCHFLTGNRAVAIRQYNFCAAVLRRELDVPPSEETTRMYRGLLAVPLAARPAEAPPELPAAHRERLGPGERARPLTDQLAMALGNLSRATTLVENVDSRLRGKG